MNLCVHQFYTFKCCIGFGRGITPAAQTSPVRRANSPDHPNPALAITEIPSKLNITCIYVYAIEPVFGAKEKKN